jgi:hypothetical protein
MLPFGAIAETALPPPDRIPPASYFPTPVIPLSGVKSGARIALK